VHLWQLQWAIAAAVSISNIRKLDFVHFDYLKIWSTGFVTMEPKKDDIHAWNEKGESMILRRPKDLNFAATIHLVEAGV
jgi:hypothetical protein